MALTYLENYVYAHNPFNKAPEKRKIHITQNYMPNVIYCVFYHTHVQNLLRGSAMAILSHANS